MNTSIATVGRRIDRLEAYLGESLLIRGKAGTSLTPLGWSLLDETSGLQVQFSRLRTFTDRHNHSGRHRPIRISATEPIVADYLAPRLPQLSNQTRVDLVAETAVSNFSKVEADLAIRMFRPREGSLVAKRVGVITLGWFTSIEYLKGRDPSEVDLRDERLLAISSSYGDIPEVNWIRDHELESSIVSESTSSRALLRAAQAGTGIAMGSKRIAKLLGLIEIPTQSIPSREIWLTSYQGNRKSSQLMAVKNWIEASIKQGPV